MANYSNKKTSKGSTRRPPGVAARRASKKSFLMAIGLAFLGGYVSAYFYSPEALKAFFQPKPPTFQPTVNTAALPTPKFEFYTLLTQEKAPVKPVKPILNALSAPILASDPASQAKHTYLLQLASFQRQEDAEQMKASLIMRGFDARIKTASQRSGVWHRVVLGPFVSRQKAEQVQAEIAQRERISSIIRRMDA